MQLASLSSDDLTALHSQLTRDYADLKARALQLNLTRGKPSPEQLDLSSDLLTVLDADDYRAADGTDCRNYGGLAGLPELRAIFSELLGIDAAQLLAGGNSSLTMMYNTIDFALRHGVDGEHQPWSAGPVKFLCPTPGYDRHFSMCQSLGIELVPVALGDDGPDMDEVRRLVADDPSIKGMWAVPAYSNPTGSVYPEPVARELVSMPTAAPDFRIFWDNAYGLHHLTDSPAPVVDILGLAEAAGNPSRVFIFASTSKITFAGAGVAFWASSPANVDWFTGHLAMQSIGPDKINQLRHAKFFRNSDGVRAHMRAHRELIEPKFRIVVDMLADRLGGYDFAAWTTPRGGYFVSLDVQPGTADTVVKLAGDAGIAMTPAGAAFPYGVDPKNSNIRIAPTYPSTEDVRAAIDGLCTCALLAATAALLNSAD
ncbi:aminotransferase class I/II-fold pyridoxal phosphate-dependent enzyme [Spelaeicoccus albus]|uniref:DNA-binding transcriptional MocR family regulator n=1 Tax=Spelaeicoccus albus TaxID=1280376 RepID=A0A7Z0D3U6_9MICO|nr:aminotransferase class I/II-fold pyridoxal phosphate-dependent enzyme [Spelaeicoccus albus]NYI68372.1 DNA-binding transcriptional MocR family regulator [Spelaeicoccus albus]